MTPSQKSSLVQSYGEHLTNWAARNSVPDATVRDAFKTASPQVRELLSHHGQQLPSWCEPFQGTATQAPEPATPVAAPASNPSPSFDDFFNEDDFADFDDDCEAQTNGDTTHYRKLLEGVASVIIKKSPRPRFVWNAYDLPNPDGSTTPVILTATWKVQGNDWRWNIHGKLEPNGPMIYKAYDHTLQADNHRVSFQHDYEATIVVPESYTKSPLKGTQQNVQVTLFIWPLLVSAIKDFREARFWNREELHDGKAYDIERRHFAIKRH